jgi:hypothetical protein
MYLAAIQAAREVRQELKRLYPGIRFNVASVGATVFVSWEGGPGRAAVKSKIDCFEVDSHDSARVGIVTSRFCHCPKCRASVFQAEPGDPVRCRICLGSAGKSAA